MGNSWRFWPALVALALVVEIAHGSRATAVAGRFARTGIFERDLVSRVALDGPGHRARLGARGEVDVDDRDRPLGAGELLHTIERRVAPRILPGSTTGEDADDAEPPVGDGHGVPHADTEIVGRLLAEHDLVDRKSTRLNSSHIPLSRMPSSA